MGSMQASSRAGVVLLTCLTIYTWLAPVVSGQCDPPFTRLDLGCYYFTSGKDSGNWFEAQEYCTGLTSDLISIETPTKDHGIRQFLLTNRPNDTFYVGGYDLGHEGKWYWLSTGMPIPWSNWAQGEPNHMKLDGEDCMVLRPKVMFQWSDDMCNGNFFFLCERSISLGSPQGTFLRIMMDGYN